MWHLTLIIHLLTEKKVFFHQEKKSPPDFIAASAKTEKLKPVDSKKCEETKY